MKYLELMTSYQTNATIVAILIIAILISGLFYYYTNDLKPTIIILLSTISVPILTGLLLVVLYEFFNVEPSEKHTLILWSSLFINTINLSMLLGRYSAEVLKKDFDIDHVTRAHFTATLNLFITVLLITAAVSAFVQMNVTIILALTLLVSSTIIWLNHLVARLLLKNK
jgi:hypothetical protein